MSMSILDLPPEIKGEIGKYLEDKDLARMSLASNQLSVVDMSELRLFHILEKIHDRLESLFILQSTEEYMRTLHELEKYILVLRSDIKKNPSMNIEFEYPVYKAKTIIPIIDMIDNAIEFETRKAYLLNQYDVYPQYISAVDEDTIKTCINSIEEILYLMDEAKFKPNPKRY